METRSKTRSKSRNNSRIQRNNDVNSIDLLNKKKSRRGKLIKSQEFIKIEDNNNNNISVIIEDNKKKKMIKKKMIKKKMIKKKMIKSRIKLKTKEKMTK